MAGTPSSNTGYDSYTDGNGVRWKIFGARGSGGSTPDSPGDSDRRTLVAYMDDDGDRVYNPAPADIMQTSTQAWDPSSNDQALNLFIALRSQVDAYAVKHRGEVALRVSAAAGGGWVLLGLLAYMIFGD